MALRFGRRRQEAQRERQELHCHACDQYVQFTMDMSLNGNHVLNCPNCGHEHCRVVRNGIITEDRWDSRNGPAIQVYSVTSSAASTYTTFSTSTTSINPARVFLYASWTNSGVT
jgi:phage terminase large subunit GpA-like protein